MKTLQKPGNLVHNSGIKRRQFLGYVAATASLTAAISACSKNDNGSIDFGSGDLGILNYAYALEQLEAAFYTRVINSPYSGINAEETELLTDIRNHEVAHREFFKAALGTTAIPSLEFDFSSIDFSGRASVLGAAQTFEDLGVSAYNGAGQLLTKADYLLIAGKIVSVEARHAAYIRDLLSYGSFADGMVTDTNGLDAAKQPADVLASASKYFKSRIDISHLPTL